MKRRVNPRRPERRFSRFGPFAAVFTVVGIGLGIAGVLILNAATTPREASAPVRGRTLRLDPSIETDLEVRHGSNALLPNLSPVPLTLDLRGPRPSNMEIRVRWRCNEGHLAREDGVLRNAFYPSGRAGVVTIEADVGFYPRSGKRTLSIPAIEKTTTLTLIAPTSGRHLDHGMLDGFRIGDYPDPRDPSLHKAFDLTNSYASIYPEKFLEPKVFYLVDDRSRQIQISRHLKLGDYALDYPWFSLGKRQYVALDPGLVRKIEALIGDLNSAGLPGDKFTIIYGFRPPAYNLNRAANDGSKSLKAPFSLHQYGKAVDFILDADGDLRLDDLNGDGQVTVRDAAVLMHHVNVLDRRYRDEGIKLYGGAGLYDHHDFWERKVQTPYVHIDVRGFLEEPSGNLIRWPKSWPDTGETIRWGKM